MASANRVESNKWLKLQCCDINGDVLSIGSLNDGDGEGNKYKNYFTACGKYITSEVNNSYKCDINNLDVCDMRVLEDGKFDCVFCSGVLEHVVDFNKAIREMHRITKVGGILLLGVPFRQAIHMAPNDYWRFTKHGVYAMLKGYYDIVEIAQIDNEKNGFPCAYWVKAEKSKR